jgi:hypothetical protein
MPRPTQPARPQQNGWDSTSWFITNDDETIRHNDAVPLPVDESDEDDLFDDTEEPSSSNESDFGMVSSSFEEPPFYSMKADDFPPYDLPRWNMTEREEASKSWFGVMEHRMRWIFHREEREGITRTRYINPFSPTDFNNRAAKAKSAHPLDNESSKFYDWNIGGTDFIVRMEMFDIKGATCLRCHYIYRPNGKELVYEDKVWNEERFVDRNIVWAGTE